MQKIAVTTGDPSGVGPEIIRSILENETDLAKRLCIFTPASLAKYFQGTEDCELITFGDPSANYEPGKPTASGAKAALESMEMAAEACTNKKCQAVVTGPVSKFYLQKTGFNHPGQTEFFAHKWGGNPSMAFYGEKLKLVLATWHIPLKDVAKAITQDALELAIERANDLATRSGCKPPKIAVCGLNPHAGENGIMGREEADFIDPLLMHLKKTYPGLSTSLPADTLFMRAIRGDFDVVVALYHDQGLAPLKAVEFDTAVNVTLGLPWIRTSPDHGTGFDIAGQRKACRKSFTNAIKVAIKLSI